MSTQANYTEGLLLLAETLGEVKTRTERLESEFATNAKPIENATSALSAALAGIKALQFHITDNNLGALSARVEEMRKAVDDQVGVIALELKKADETNAAKAGAEAEALRSEIVALQSQLGSLVTQFGQQLERVEFAAKEEAKKLQLIPGPAGASLNPRGTFIDGETYNRLDVVSWLGSSYIATVDGVTEKPSKNSNQWQVLASRGGNAGGASMVPLPDVYGKPSNGQLLIGNGNDYVNATLTAGNGIAVTNGSGSITIEATGAVNYQGAWNASTNSPTLTSSVGTKGYYYVVSVAGSTNLNGITDWQAGDWAVFNGTAWEKIDNTDRVSSVFGRTGAVVGVSTDYSSVGITNTAIGASNPSTGAFTTLSATGTLTVSGTGVSQIFGTLLVGSQGAIGASLDVQTASGTASTLRLFQSGVSNWVWSVPASTDALVLSQYGTTEAMRFDSSRNAAFTGNVETTGAAASNRFFQVVASGTLATAIGNNTSGSTNAFGIPTGSSFVGNAQAYPLVFSTSATERARITSGGNVLIGTTTDGGQKLQVAGNLTASGGSITVSGGAYPNFYANGTTGGGFTIQKSGVSYGTFYGNDSNTVLDSAGSANLILQTGGATRATLTSTATTLTGNLTVSGTGTSSVAGLLNVGTGTANYSAAGRATVSISGGSQSLLGFSIGNATKGYLLHEGTNLYVSNEAAGAVIIAGGSSTTSATFTSTLTTLAGNLNVSGTGTSEFSGKIRGTYLGVNANPQSGSLRGYFVESTAEGTPTFTGGEVIVVQRNAISAQACEMALIGGTASTCVYAFGDKDSANIGRISYDHSNNSLALVTNSATAATITSGGNLLVGTTTNGGQKLQVVSGDAYIARFTDGSTASLNIQKSAIVFANAGISAYAAGNYDASSHTFKIQTVTALTLDSSQNATFAGNVTISSAYPKITLTDTNNNSDFSLLNDNGRLAVYDETNSAYRITVGAGGGVKIGTTPEDVGANNLTVQGVLAIGNTVNTVSPTSPNRTITMVIGGTTYYLHAKTTND